MSDNPTYPQVHGHRGARGLLPENSLVAIEQAIALGCDGVEVDLCISADHHLIIHHDPILSTDLVRGENGEWISPSVYIYQLTLEDIKKINVGKIRPNTDYSRNFSQQISINRVSIPTLDEFVNLTNKLNSNITLNLELKSMPDNKNAFPDTDQHIDLVASKLCELNIQHRTFLQSFDWTLALGVKQKCPAVTVGLLTDQQPDGHPMLLTRGSKSHWTNNHNLNHYLHLPDIIRQCGGQVWSPNFLDICKQDVDIAHQLGLKVCAWTVNELQDMQTIVDMQVDIITTDYPDRLLLALLQTQTTKKLGD